MWNGVSREPHLLGIYCTAEEFSTRDGSDQTQRASQAQGSHSPQALWGSSLSLKDMQCQDSRCRCREGLVMGREG